MSKCFFFGLLILLWACSNKTVQVQYQSKTEELFSSTPVAHPLDTLVSPYRRALEQEMNSIIGYASCGMVKNRPEGGLGNFCADLVQEYAQAFLSDSIPKDRIITILNHGGLRAPINQGPIHLSDVYELMPFDNKIAFVKLKAEKFRDIMAYLNESGGEPISGFSSETQAMSGDFWVATSDYLAEGGDKMTFFKNPMQLVVVDLLLRDQILFHIQKSDTICQVIDGRWE